jgi:hypothetical protein
MTIAGFAAISIAVAVIAGEKSDLLDAVVHALLQQAMQTRALLLILISFSRNVVSVQ